MLYGKPLCYLPAFACRPNLSYGKRLDKMVQHLPYCQTLEEKRCIDRIGERAKKLIVKNPCIQMLYKGVKTTGKDRDKRHATYRLIFEEPPMV